MDAVIWVGIQAAGKSTFYQQRFFATHVRVSLDLLRTRRRLTVVEDLPAREAYTVWLEQLVNGIEAQYGPR